ncbi:1789_t:CDS:2, partial [Scutellospora calospora]
RLEMDLKDIKNFEYSQFSEPQRIGQGGFAVVYSTVLQGEKYALKSLNNNLVLDDKAIKQIRRELKFLHMTNHPNVIKLYGTSRVIWKILKNEKEKKIENTPLGYVELYEKCQSSSNQRPTLDEISKKLDLLEETTVEFITNNINIAMEGLLEETTDKFITNHITTEDLLKETNIESITNKIATEDLLEETTDEFITNNIFTKDLLEETTAEFITNNIVTDCQQITQPNNAIEDKNTDKHLEGDKDESNDNIRLKEILGRSLVPRLKLASELALVSQLA